MYCVCVYMYAFCVQVPPTPNTCGSTSITSMSGRKVTKEEKDICCLNFGEFILWVHKGGILACLLIFLFVQKEFKVLTIKTSRKNVLNTISA